MTLEAYKNELLKKAREMGCTDAEVHCSESEHFAVTVRNQSIDSYKIAKDISLSLRVVFAGHDGFASTEVFENPDELIKHAMDNAQTVDSIDEHPLQGKSEYARVIIPEQPLNELDEHECIELARSIEKKALDFDARVARVTGSNVFKMKSTETISNTLGLDASHTSELTGTSLGIVMSENGEEKVSGDSFYGANAMNIDSGIAEIVADCADKFGAEPVPSGEYKVLFTNKGFCMMLDLFAGVFSAYAAQKGLSLLADKEGTQIASDCVTLCDDPCLEIYPIPFDLEGVPTQYKNIIENGKLQTLLHSLKTANNAGVNSTGNGTRTGACSFTNFYLKPREKSFSDLTCGERVLVISELDGAGTGVNEISGEFSLSAKGQLYENGVRVRSVNQITVAGSFYELLMDITDVGNDLIFPETSGMGFVGSPCVLVKKLMVAG